MSFFIGTIFLAFGFWVLISVPSAPSFLEMICWSILAGSVFLGSIAIFLYHREKLQGLQGIDDFLF